MSKTLDGCSSTLSTIMDNETIAVVEYDHGLGRYVLDKNPHSSEITVTSKYNQLIKHDSPDHDYYDLVNHSVKTFPNITLAMVWIAEQL